MKNSMQNLSQKSSLFAFVYENNSRGNIDSIILK